MTDHTSKRESRRTSCTDRRRIVSISIPRDIYDGIVKNIQNLSVWNRFGFSTVAYNSWHEENMCHGTTNIGVLGFRTSIVFGCHNRLKTKNYFIELTTTAYFTALSRGEQFSKIFLSETNFSYLKHYKTVNRKHYFAILFVETRKDTANNVTSKRIAFVLIWFLTVYSVLSHARTNLMARI